MKNFKFADPLIHEDLFKLAEIYTNNFIDEIDNSKHNSLPNFL